MAYPNFSLPNTQHTVFYSYAITVNGIQIGSFEKFSSSFTRTAERIREVYFSRGAQTKEIVWAGTDIQVTVDRVEMYDKSLLQAFGFQIYTIEDMNKTLDIHEAMYFPANRDSSTDPAGNFASRMITYVGCVATNATKEINVTGAKIIESMTFECRTVIGEGQAPAAP